MKERREYRECQCSALNVCGESHLECLLFNDHFIVYNHHWTSLWGGIYGDYWHSKRVTLCVHSNVQYRSVQYLLLSFVMYSFPQANPPCKTLSNYIPCSSSREWEQTSYRCSYFRISVRLSLCAYVRWNLVVDKTESGYNAHCDVAWCPVQATHTHVYAPLHIQLFIRRFVWACVIYQWRVRLRAWRKGRSNWIERLKASFIVRLRLKGGDTWQCIYWYC